MIETVKEEVTQSLTEGLKVRQMERVKWHEGVERRNHNAE